MAKLLQPSKVLRYTTRGGKWSKYHIIKVVDSYKGVAYYNTMCDHQYDGSDQSAIDVKSFADVGADDICGMCLHGFAVGD
jgi:hypothetical protein